MRPQEGIKEVGTALYTYSRHPNLVRRIAGSRGIPGASCRPRRSWPASPLAVDSRQIKELTLVRASSTRYLADLRVRLEDCESILERMGLGIQPASAQARLTSLTLLRMNALLARRHRPPPEPP